MRSKNIIENIENILTMAGKTQNSKASARKAGRPKAKINWTLVDRLLVAGASGTSIAARLGIHPNTLYETCKEVHNCDFSDYSQKKRQVGDDMILSKQFDTAMEGNVPMLIFLGKARLGQQETHAHEVKMQVEDLSLYGRLTREQAAQLLKDVEQGEDE